MLTGPRQSARPRSRAPVPVRGLAQLLRPRGSREPGAARRADDCPRAAEGARGHRRGPASPRSLPGPARARRSPPAPARFLILGSASPDLLRAVFRDAGGTHRDRRIGGFAAGRARAAARRQALAARRLPARFLARTEADSVAWRKQFIQTFSRARPAAAGASRVPATRAAALLDDARALPRPDVERRRAGAVAGRQRVHACRRYLDLLSDVLMVRQLQPWHENLGKRQVKSPKVYVRDSGLLHQLFGPPPRRPCSPIPRSAHRGRAS